MQEAEWVIGSFLKRLGVGERLGRFRIEKLIEYREVQNFQRALLQDVFHQRKSGHLTRFNPDVTFYCIEDC